MQNNRPKNPDLVTWLFLLETGVVLLGTVFLFVFWVSLPPSLPWFYSLPWGEGQLIPKIWFGLGLGALELVIIFNYFLSRRLRKYDEVVALVVGGSTLLLTAIYLAGFARVVSIMLWSL